MQKTELAGTASGIHVLTTSACGQNGNEILVGSAMISGSRARRAVVYQSRWGMGCLVREKRQLRQLARREIGGSGFVE
jgi:hypothetical protein